MLEYKDSIAWEDKQKHVVNIIHDYNKELLLRTIDKASNGKEYEFIGTATKEELFAAARERQILGWPECWIPKDTYAVEEA